MGKSVAYFLMSAEGGYGLAMYMIGVYYECGFVYAQNSQEALNWYEKSRDAGYEGANEAINRILRN